MKGLPMAQIKTILISINKFEILKIHWNLISGRERVWKGKCRQIFFSTVVTVQPNLSSVKRSSKLTSHVNPQITML